VDTDL